LRLVICSQDNQEKSESSDSKETKRIERSKKAKAEWKKKIEEIYRPGGVKRDDDDED